MNRTPSMSDRGLLVSIVPPKKTPLFSTEERELLCRLVNEEDPNQTILKCTAKTTAAREKKTKVWDKITTFFYSYRKRRLNS